LTHCTLWPAVLLFVPLLIPLATRCIFAYDDLPSFHLPVRQMYSSALRDGHSVLWTSSLFGGFYLHAEGQVGAFHPPHYVIYRLLPVITALNIELISSYVAALAGMCLFLYRRGLRAPACILGATSFAFCGFNLLHLIHLNAVAVMAHVPSLLYAIDLVLAGGKRQRAAGSAAVSLLVGSQLLLGYPQYVWISGMVCGVYALMRARELGAARQLPVLAAAAMIGVTVGGAQLLPTVDLLRRSIRAEITREFQLSYSLHPLNLLQLCVPYLFANRVHARPEELIVHELGLYNGAMCTIAVCWCAVRWKQLWSRSLAAFAGVLSIVGLLLTLGRYGLLYEVLTYLPIIGSFRAPARHVVMLHIGLAVLLAIAFDDLLRLTRPQRRPALLAVAVPVSAAVLLTCLALAGVFGALAGPTAPAQTLLLGALPMAIAGLLVTQAAAAKRVALTLIPIVAAIDLGVWGYTYVWRTPPLTLGQIAASADAPPTFVPGMLVHAKTWEDRRNRMLLRGLRLYRPYVGLPPSRLLPDDSLVTWRLSGVEWVRDEKAWSPVSSPMPRARVLFDARASTDPAADLDTIDITRTALVYGSLPPVDGEAHGGAAVLTDTPGRLEFDISVSGRAILATTESYHSGWVARIGSRKSPTLRLYGDYVGVALEPGDYRVAIEFKPKSTTFGVILTLAGLAATLTGAVGVWRWTPGHRKLPTPNSRLSK
jgi:hypothetical protein